MNSILKTAFYTILVCTVFSGKLPAAEEISQEIWIDVRSPQEFSQGHRDGAVNIPFLQISQRIPDITQDKSAEIRLYCAAGARAAIAKQILDGMGYQNVINKGGLENARR